MNSNDPNTSTHYDRTIGGLEGLPDVVKTHPSTKRTVTPLARTSETYIIQTMRQKDVGDYIFIEMVSGEGSLRIVLPPAIAETIARQRESVIAKVRSKTAKAQAQERKDRGELPAFLKKKKA